mmetsp:Transcript_6824/g.11881  ORF Transcript_6824/g.11881 Transcript_6824/m.11881 type:complete len:238 (-) Transcript_6824:42-755(-)
MRLVSAVPKGPVGREIFVIAVGSIQKGSHNINDGGNSSVFRNDNCVVGILTPVRQNGHGFVGRRQGPVPARAAFLLVFADVLQRLQVLLDGGTSRAMNEHLIQYGSSYRVVAAAHSLLEFQQLICAGTRLGGRTSFETAAVAGRTTSGPSPKQRGRTGRGRKGRRGSALSRKAFDAVLLLRGIRHRLARRKSYQSFRLLFRWTRATTAAAAAAVIAVVCRCSLGVGFGSETRWHRFF